MTDAMGSIDKLLESLQERAKELNCIYSIEEILNRPGADLDQACRAIIEVIPPGWQYPDICQAEIELMGKVFRSPHFQETPWVQHADIRVQEKTVGRISVSYTREVPEEDHGPFLKEETKLINTIADRLGHFVTYHQIRQMSQDLESARKDLMGKTKGEWRVILDLLRQTDRDLYSRISHKMLNHLCWSGITDAQKLLHDSQPNLPTKEEVDDDLNRPHRWTSHAFAYDSSEETFRIAAEHLSDDEILSYIQKWIQEDKLGFLVQVVNRHLTLPVVADAIRRYHHLGPEQTQFHGPARRGVEVALIRRFLSDQLEFINIAKNFIRLGDFFSLLQNLIHSSDSHGKLGGKSAGLYLARHILKKSAEADDLLAQVKTPKTWNITSDILLHFMHYNDLDDVVEQKYKEINQVRQEYPHIVQMFKRSRFPSDIIKGLSMALDDFGDRPLIVRSSSLLEDRMGAAFSGKYKSLFLANQGTKEERLDALTDAIAEVYASTFGPDPIEYRAERGLIDFGEEMGIMIQEVVGNRVGDYFLPAFAGVAFSRNEFRWSPRIKREDGLLRIVPGLGTRAVDRLADDYPVLIAPGQPNLRVNATVDEVLRYAPKKIDVINLKTNTFETVDIIELVQKYGHQLPGIDQIISAVGDGDVLQQIGPLDEFEGRDLAVTFKGLITNSPLIKKIAAILRMLEEKLHFPVDIEFASDGKDFYLLQCRPQSSADVTNAAPIPKDIPEDRIVFSADRYVSNGRLADITHIVYVDPQKYTELPDRSALLAVGRAVGKLNKRLPKRQFILIGPGRWGSRGDIRLGVSVTYSEINNTGALIEIAHKRGNYVPDLSFGTHFFQDLVEAGIRYLPLYPDDDGIVFNERFLTRSPNILSDFLPEFAELGDTIRLIDVPKATGGLSLHLLMNAELDEAVAILAESKPEAQTTTVTEPPDEKQPETYWRWRLEMAQRVASQLDPERFGVVGFYIFGSTKNATAGPGSDVDILLHFRGVPKQRQELETWLNGWSLALDEMNYLQTGYRSDGLLDVHIVTDEDIAKRTSYAAKIGAVTDAARPLPMKNAPDIATESPV